MKTSIDSSEYITRSVEEVRERFPFPGISCGYLISNQPLKTFSYGYADREANTKMAPSSRLLAASIGKTFVAATVIELAHKGFFKLDDKISNFLSDYDWFSRLANHEAITLRHLLTHTSGLSDHVYTEKFQQWITAGNDNLRPESLLSCVLDLEPQFQAGRGFAYTDTGYILLGLIIERALTCTYDEYLTNRFLKRLKLNSTSASNQKSLPGLVAGYTNKDNPFKLPLKVVNADGTLVWNPISEWTGGGIISTASDLATWAKLLYEGHAMEFDYLADLLRYPPTVSNVPFTHYGAGTVIITESPLGKIYGHYGIIPGYASSMRYYPEYALAIAFQVNTDEEASKFIPELERCIAENVISVLAPS